MGKYKNHIYLIIVFVLVALVHTLSYDDEQSTDPMPYAHGGLGCITDSECESVERGDDNLPLSVNE